MSRSHVHALSLRLLTASLCVLAYMTFAPVTHAASIVDQRLLCSPTVSASEHTSTRSSRVGIKACLYAQTLSPPRSIRVQPVIEWSNEPADSSLNVFAVDFNSITFGGSLVTPTIGKVLTWARPPLGTINAMNFYRFTTANSVVSTVAGFYSFTATTTYDVKDDGLPARTMSATISRTIT